jgi:acetyl-CoA decarbonylase/synthase complex subunit gamma
VRKISFKAAETSCGPSSAAGIDKSREDRYEDRGEGAAGWVTGTVMTPAGEVRKVSAEWSWRDRWGAARSRLGAFRMRYAVRPGLYAVGEPGAESDVFASANYKLSFDLLRRALLGLDAWVLVLDTRSINVWCAAGKGTFGTHELINRISGAGLEKVVNHGRIILPQLGAPGVSAHLVKKKTGFRVYYGPVYARDIPAYLEAGRKASREMRTVRFTLLDRLVLTPMELRPAFKKFPLFALLVLILFGLEPSGILFRDALYGGLPYLALGLTSVLAGALITPALLPVVPFRSFALKGWIVGMVSTAVFLEVIGGRGDALLLTFTYLFFPMASSYIALQFTGATTFTGISGVKKELRFAIPVYISSVVVSAGLLFAHKLAVWGVI